MTAPVKNRPGFTLIEALIILVVLAVIGVLGYTFYTRMTGHADQPQAVDVQSAPEITQAGDLDKADTVLDQTDPSAGSDLNELESMTSGF